MFKGSIACRNLVDWLMVFFKPAKRAPILHALHLWFVYNMVTHYGFRTERTMQISVTAILSLKLVPYRCKQKESTSMHGNFDICGAHLISNRPKHETILSNDHGSGPRGSTALKEKPSYQLTVALDLEEWLHFVFIFHFHVRGYIKF